MTENNMDTVLLFLGGLLVLLFIGVLVIRFFVNVYIPFVEERDYIQMEIARNYGRERIRWKKELRRLYIAQIPFVGVHLAEADRKRSKNKRHRK